MQMLAEETVAVRPGNLPSPGALVERQDSAAQVLDMIDRLPANQQEAIRLKFQSGLSYREISRVMGLTVSHVGVLIHTGLKSVRTKLKCAEA
jgi:RNA polymerase sigma-70 factor (ECF subfamily)